MISDESFQASIMGSGKLAMILTILNSLLNKYITIIIQNYLISISDDFDHLVDLDLDKLY